eukprot:2937698-Amphidinium_carterae.1
MHRLQKLSIKEARDERTSESCAANVWILLWVKIVAYGEIMLSLERLEKAIVVIQHTTTPSDFPISATCMKRSAAGAHLPFTCKEQP